jgi:carboxymethylenebutenolidase
MPDSPTLAHLSVPPGGSGPAVLVIHSWWGLTSSFTEFADRLAGSGFLVGCADLYGGRLASTAKEARALRRAPRREPMYRTLRAALEEIVAHPAATQHDPAVVGFSMGGHWAVWLAQHPPPRLSAVVLYYSARAGNYDLAEAPVLAHFAESDAFVTPNARRTMERVIARAGITYEWHDYPRTQHWFAESDNAAHDEKAAAIALERTIRFLEEHTAG